MTRGLPRRRRPGGRGAGLRRRRALTAEQGRQDRRPGQPVRRAGQEARLTARSTSTRSPGRARWSCIADDTTRRRFHRRRPDRPGRARAGLERSSSPGTTALIDAVAAELEKQLATLRARRPGAAVARSVRRADPGARRRRSGRSWPTSWRPSTCTSPAAKPSELARRDSQRRRDLPRAVQPGAAGRLRGRPVARAADRRDGPLRQRPVGERLPAVEQHDPLHARRAWRQSPTTCFAMADEEGLTGHAASVAIRLTKNRMCTRRSRRHESIER